MTLTQNSFFRSIRFYYPLTFTGTLLFAAGVWLLGDAFNSKSIYSLIMATVSLSVLFYLAVSARIQAFRLGGIQIVWDSASVLTARVDGIVQKIHLKQAESSWFFRIHFALRGLLHAGRRAPLYVYTEHSVTGGEELQIPLYFPVSGKLDVKGRLSVRDVFGLVRAVVSDDEERSFTVRPPVFPLMTSAGIRSFVNEESSRKKQSSEAEKYYMREYMPGDRMKDINWKASLRVFELITRISPVSPEPSRMLHIEFRHYRSGEKDGIQSVMHLNYLKSQLMSFITALKVQFPEFRFRILTADGPKLLETMNDIDRFAAYLGGIGFVSPSRMYQDTDASVREKFVFTTCFDESIISLPGTAVHLYRTGLKTDFRQKVRNITFFSRSAGGLSSLSVAVPGLWVLRREKKPSVSPAGFKSVTEERISVRIL